MVEEGGGGGGRDAPRRAAAAGHVLTGAIHLRHCDVLLFRANLYMSRRFPLSSLFPLLPSFMQTAVISSIRPFLSDWAEVVQHRLRDMNGAGHRVSFDESRCC